MVEVVADPQDLAARQPGPGQCAEQVGVIAGGEENVRPPGAAVEAIGLKRPLQLRPARTLCGVVADQVDQPDLGGDFAPQLPLRPTGQQPYVISCCGRRIGDCHGVPDDPRGTEVTDEYLKTRCSRTACRMGTHVHATALRDGPCPSLAATFDFANVGGPPAALAVNWPGALYQSRNPGILTRENPSD